jgi:hypothetical protein
MPATARVFVHRTTDPHAPKFSIHDLATGAVVEQDEVWLADAFFEVSDSGRYRAVIEHRRTVHAGIFGTLLSNPPRGARCDCPVRYMPGRDPFFLNDDYRPVHKARVVHLVNGMVYVPREARWL